MSIYRTDEELDNDVLAEIHAAGKKGIIGQDNLAHLVRCSKQRLTQRMAIITAKASIRHPGQSLQAAPYRIGASGRPPIRYRITDEQTEDEIRQSRTRTRSGQTHITRARHEINVIKAGPAGQAVVTLLGAVDDLLERASQILEQPETV